MALRIPKAELAPEIAEPMTAQFGAVPEPLEVVSHNRKVAESAVQFSVLIGGWDTVAEDLKTFSHMAVAAQVGCSWCLDINYFQAQNHNLDMAKKPARCHAGGRPTCSPRWSATCWSTPRP
jgi:hypothetical protein